MSKAKPITPADWQSAIDDLRAKREAAADRVGEIAEQRSDIAFDAERGDEKAAKQAGELRSEAVTAQLRVDDLDYAIARAEKGHQDAVQAEDEKIRAKYRREAADEAGKRVEAAERVDKALELLSAALHDWAAHGSSYAELMRQAGVKAPSSEKLRSSQALFGAVHAADPELSDRLSIPRAHPNVRGPLADRERRLLGLSDDRVAA